MPFVIPGNRHGRAFPQVPSGSRPLREAKRSRRASSAIGEFVLVCLHLTGGNDGNNMIVPLEGAQYSAYSALRGPLAIPSGDLLAFQAVRNPGQFGFHPALAEVRDLYNQGALAIVANTGSEQKPAFGHEYEGMTFLAGGHMVPSFGAPKSGAGFSTARYGVVITALDGGTADIGSHEVPSAVSRTSGPWGCCNRNPPARQLFARRCGPALPARSARPRRSGVEGQRGSVRFAEWRAARLRSRPERGQRCR